MSELSKIKGISAQLVNDLASTLYDPQQVFAAHDISDAEAVRLLKHPHFKEMLKSARVQWQAIGNTNKRVRAKALMLLEDSLEEIFLTVTDHDTNAAAKAALLKELRAVAGIDNNDSDSRAAPLPTVTIYLNGEGGAVEVKPKATPDFVDAEVEYEDGHAPEIGLEDMIWKDD